MPSAVDNDLNPGKDMVHIKKNLLIYLVILSLFMAFRPAASLAADPAGIISYRNASWTNLTFNYTGILTNLTVEIKMQSLAVINDRLLTKVGASLAETDAAVKEMKLMTVDLKTEGRFIFNEQYTEKIWFNSSNGRAYRRIRHLKSEDPWVKVYSWTERGVYRKKIQPADRRESNQDPIKWTNIKESFYPYPVNDVYSKVVSDPVFLLNYVSRLAPLNPRNPSQVLVFGKEQLYRLTCRREKSRPMPVSYKTHTSSGETDIKKTLTPIIFSVTAEPYPYKEKESEPFSLLGLQEDIYIYLDPVTYLPIRISGKNSVWGELVLDLSSARIN